MNIPFNIHDERALRSIDLHELLPQQDPFVLVDRLVSIDDCITVTETQVRPDFPFLEDGVLQAEGMIENIAQTCAVRIGYVNKYLLHRDIEVGYIGQLTKTQVIALPHVGDVLHTTVTVTEQVWGMTLAHAIIERDGETLIEGDIKIALKRKEQ